MSLKKVRIGDFLKRSKIPVDIEDNKEYKRVTIRINHNGVSMRDVEKGRQIGTKKQFILRSGQFVMSKIDARYGAFGIAPDEVDNAIITGNFWAYDVDDQKLNIEWFNQFTNSPDFYDLCERASSGITHRKYLNETFFLNYEIELPSTEEQLGIIENIKSQKISFLNLSTELTHQLTLVQKLRQQLLQEAVQGKLVPQDPSDEPASILLQKIKAEKERLVKEKKIKKDKDLPEIKAEEIPFEIPEGWVWCRLGEIGKFTGGGTPSMANADYWNGNIPWVSPKDMWVEIVSDSEMKITAKAVAESTANIIPTGSLLIVGRSGILKRKLPVAVNSVECTVNQDMKVIIPYLVTMNRYLQLLLQGLEKVILRDYVKFGMTVHSLKYQEFELMPIPLPPLSEQHRIVQKLEQLLQDCDALQASIQESRGYNEQLLQQVLREALKGG
jgi:type I restriction enzyme S subunit